MKYFLMICVIAMIYSCSSNSSPEKHDTNLAISEPQGIADEISAEISASVLEMMGGQEKWDATRYLAWNFFGARDLIWDKWTGNVRIDFPSAKSVYVVNVNSGEGKVWRDGEAVNQPDSLKKYLSAAKSIWINDSYWLAMPFKLRDEGVSLSYVGEDTTALGLASHVLKMTFDDVGDTPDNKYHIHITKSDGLIKQWDFYKSASQDKPSVVWPWDNYKDFDGLLLSGDRSDGKGPKNIRVYDDIPDIVFEALKYPDGILQPADEN